MPYFRFLDSRYIDKWLSGNLRVGNARYYRLLETITNDDFIGDCHEAQTIVDTGPVLITPGNREPKTTEMLKTQRFFDNVPEGMTIDMPNGMQTLKRVECFILSLSFGGLADLKPSMTNPRKIKPSYDGCVEILDIEAFCRHIEKEAKINGAPFKDFFNRVEHKTVKYTGQNTDIYSRKIEADPFLKLPKYEVQKEYRLVFYPQNKPWYEDHVNIFIPNANKFIREVFRHQGTLSLSSPEDYRSINCLIKILTITRRNLCKYEKGEGHPLTQKQLNTVIRAYWSLRNKGHGSAQMDDSLDPYRQQAFSESLKEYLRARPYRKKSRKKK